MTILAAVINVVVNILTIKWLGLYAASISTVVAYLSMAIYRFIDSRKYVKISLNYKFLISILIMFAITIVAYYVRNIMICALIAVVVVIYTIFINRKNVKFVMNIYKEIIKKVKDGKARKNMDVFIKYCCLFCSNYFTLLHTSIFLL